MNKKDMNSHFYLRQLKQTAIVMLLLFAGCRDEQIIPDNPTGGNTELPGGRVAYTIRTNAPQFDRPTTRTGKADEDNVGGDLWVFVFDARPAASDDALFLEAVKASDHEAAGTGASKRTAILKTRDHAVTLLVLDNTPAKYHDGTQEQTITDEASWGLTAATKLSEARARLNTVLLATPSVSTVPYTPTLKIPLSIEKSFTKLDPSTNLGTADAPLLLDRMVARITVAKDFRVVAGYTPPAFALKGATVYNTPRNASLFPVHKDNSANLTNYIGTGASNEIIGIAAATADDTKDNPIYLYPSAEATAANQPFVLIQAQYDTDTDDTYYKLAIAPAGKPLGQVDRNTDYRFLIKSCTGRGYATLAEAAAAPPSNLVYAVEVTDLSSHDIIDNGQYYIGLSNSEYHFHAQSSFSNLPVATLYTGTNPGAAPFTGVVSITSSDPVNLIVESPTIAHPATNATIRAAVTKEFTEGTLTLRLGNLTKTIRMVRTGSSFITGDLIVNDTYKDPKYKVASVETPRPWIKLGTSPAVTLANGQDMVATNNDGVYIAYNANMAKPDLENSVYISRSTGEGRIKAHFLLAPLEYLDSNAPGNINKDGKNLSGSSGQWDFHFLNPSGYNYTLALFPDEGTVNKPTEVISTDDANTTKKLEYSPLVLTDEDRALMPRLLVAKFKVGDYWYETPYYVQQRYALQINILTVGYNGIDYHRTDYSAPVNGASSTAQKALYGIQVGANVNIGCQYSDGIGRLLYRQTGPGKPIEMPIQMYNLCYDITANAGTANYDNNRVLNALSDYNIDILVCFVHGTNFNGTHGPSKEQAQDIIDKWLLKSKYRGMLYTCDAINANKGWTEAIFGQGQTYSGGSGALTRLATNDPYYHHPVYRSIMSGSYSRYENYPEASDPVLYGSDVTAAVGSPASRTYSRNSSLDPVIGLRDPSIAFYTPVTYGFVPLSLVNEKGFIPLFYHTGTTNVTLAVHPDKRIIFQGELQYYQASHSLNADGSLQATAYGPFPKMMMNMWEWFFNNVALGKKY